MTFKIIAIGSNCYQWQTNQADIDIEIDIDIVIEIDTGREMEDPACGGMAAEAAGREIKILSGFQKLGMQAKK